MTREIKFRAWDIYNKVMVFDMNKIYECYIDNEHRGLKWMQFTGLKDKECKEIYEGDIMLNEDGMGDIWICEFNEGMFVYRLPLENGDEIIPINEPKGFKIIGNIYKNPELLK